MSASTTASGKTAQNKPRTIGELRSIPDYDARTASLSVKNEMRRNLLRSIDSIPGMYAVGIVSIFLSSQNKRLGDFVAGTIVVHERNLEELKPFPAQRLGDFR